MKPGRVVFVAVLALGLCLAGARAARAEVYDSFTTSGRLFDKWRVAGEEEGTLECLSKSNGYLYFTSSNNYKYLRLEGKSSFRGDFSVEVDVSSFSAGFSNSNGLAVAGIYIRNFENSYDYDLLKFYDAEGFNSIVLFDSESSTLLHNVSSQLTSFKLKMVRTGSSFSAYYHNGTTFVLIGTWSNPDFGRALFGLYVESDNTSYFNLGFPEVRTTGYSNTNYSIFEFNEIICANVIKEDISQHVELYFNLMDYNEIYVCDDNVLNNIGLSVSDGRAYSKNDFSKTNNTLLRLHGDYNSNLNEIIWDKRSVLNSGYFITFPTSNQNRNYSLCVRNNYNEEIISSGEIYPKWTTLPVSANSISFQHANGQLTMTWSAAPFSAPAGTLSVRIRLYKNDKFLQNDIFVNNLPGAATSITLNKSVVDWIRTTATEINCRIYHWSHDEQTLAMSNVRSFRLAVPLPEPYTPSVDMEDAGNDGAVGLQEAIRALQVSSGIR